MAKSKIHSPVQSDDESPLSNMNSDQIGKLAELLSKLYPPEEKTSSEIKDRLSNRSNTKKT